MTSAQRQTPGADPRPLPVFVNPRAGSSARVLQALSNVSGIAVQPVDPSGLADAIRGTVAAGARRVAVSGGDGTIATAAAAVVGTQTELAIVPGGTLNHFALDYGIPHDPARAIAAALGGGVRTVDVGTVNGRVFINTSSVGAYVTFVRTRERIEHWAGYRLASLVAAARLWPGIRPFRISVDSPREAIRAESPLVFVGVGERSLSPREIGGRTPGGARALHLVLVHGRKTVRRWANAMDCASLGRPGKHHEITGPLVDAILVDGCRVELPRSHANVAVDGEIVSLSAPLVYQLHHDVLRVIVPMTANSAAETREQPSSNNS